MKKLLFLCFVWLSMTFSYFDYKYHLQPILQGDTGKLIIITDQILQKPYLQLNQHVYPGKRILKTKNKNIYRFFIPTTPFTSTGRHYIKVFYNNKKHKTLPIDIVKKNFKIQYIKLPKTKVKLLTSKKLLNESRIIGSKFRETTDKPYWKNNFKMPTQGKITSVYGSQRRYNNHKIKWWHKGIDIAGKEGQKVVAPNDGKIILAENNFQVHGKTLMINHGHGIVSILIHLKSLQVKNGQFVKKGQKIALLGQSGIATGPHVHWGLSVNNVRVNPLQWVNRNFAPNFF